MKKIYLIDDNLEGQQQRYGCTFLLDGTYNTILECIYSVRLPDFDKAFRDQLKNASLILIHDTFKDRNAKGDVVQGGLIIRDYIVEKIAREREIPLVLFSNGIGEPRLTGPQERPIQLEIKKTRFYEHLKDFLEHYQSTDGKIELRILIHGKNFLLSEAMILRDRLMNSVAKSNNNELINFSNESKEDLKEMFFLAGRKEEWEELVKNRDLTVCNFRAIIRQLYERIQDHE